MADSSDKPCTNLKAISSSMRSGSCAKSLIPQSRIRSLNSRKISRLLRELAEARLMLRLLCVASSGSMASIAAISSCAKWPQRLGSDVPVCIHSETCRMRGTGEIIEPFREFGRHHAVLVNPGIPLPTVSVFARLGLERQSNAFSPIEFPLVLAECRNDLTDAAIALAPQIRTVLAMLEAQKGANLIRDVGLRTHMLLPVRYQGKCRGSCREESRPKSLTGGVARRRSAIEDERYSFPDALSEETVF